MKEKDVNKPKDIFKQPGAPWTVNILIYFCFWHGCLISVRETPTGCCYSSIGDQNSFLCLSLRCVYFTASDLRLVFAYVIDFLLSAQGAERNK